MADPSPYLKNLFGLEGKVAVVIGGTGELCGTMAEGLAAAGAEVVLVGRSEEKANVRLQNIADAGGKGYFANAEVGNRESLNDLLDSVIEQSGRADILINTTQMTPHDLRADLSRLLAPGGATLSISVQSFSYKRGLPRGLDVVLDCRFLRNPHWDAKLRDKDGRDQAVDAYVSADPLFESFFARTKSLIDLMLPAQRKEGKTHVAIGFGCTGGQHRSVSLAERFGAALAQEGWPVSIRHREMERRGTAAASSGQQGSLV